MGKTWPKEPCPQCGQKYSTNPGRLADHIRRKHPDSEHRLASGKQRRDVPKLGKGRPRRRALIRIAYGDGREVDVRPEACQDEDGNDLDNIKMCYSQDLTKAVISEALGGMYAVHGDPKTAPGKA